MVEICILSSGIGIVYTQNAVETLSKEYKCICQSFNNISWTLLKEQVVFLSQFSAINIHPLANLNNNTEMTVFNKIIELGYAIGAGKKVRRRLCCI